MENAGLRDLSSVKIGRRNDEINFPVNSAELIYIGFHGGQNALGFRALHAAIPCAVPVMTVKTVLTDLPVMHHQIIRTDRFQIMCSIYDRNMLFVSDFHDRSGKLALENIQMNNIRFLFVKKLREFSRRLCRIEKVSRRLHELHRISGSVEVDIFHEIFFLIARNIPFIFHREPDDLMPSFP